LALWFAILSQLWSGILSLCNVIGTLCQFAGCHLGNLLEVIPMSVCQLGFRPRNGHTLKVIAVCRVSSPGPGKQDIRSLDDQLGLIRNYLDRESEVPFEITEVCGQGSGENLNRREFLELMELVESGEYDLVISEDLGRICRRIRAHEFAELCADFGTRLIAINDHVDTAQDGWQDHSIFSAWHHERSNRDTSERIKRSHRNRFKEGGCAQFPIYGIIKPPGSKKDSEWSKDPAAEQVVHTVVQMLLQNGNYSEVADWLNEHQVPVGPHCRQQRWTGAAVARWIHNPILSGRRFRNKKVSKRRSDGKYVAVSADPDAILWREVPHLAFLSRQEHESLLEKLDSLNANRSRRYQGKSDPRSSIPRKRTRFPGQMTFCGICGRLYVFGGHGQTDHLMCDGARAYHCWNGVTLDAKLTSRKILEAVYSEIASLPDFDEVFLQEVRCEAEHLNADRNLKIKELETLEQTVESELNRLIDFVQNGSTVPQLMDRIVEKQGMLSSCQNELHLLRSRPVSTVEIPEVQELKRLAHETLQEFQTDNWKFQQLMQRIISRIVVFPVAPCDGGNPRCRVRFRLRLSGLLEDRRQQEILESPLERVVTVDLFEVPQRIQFREQVVSLRSQGMTERAIAKSLGITITAAQRASALQRLMDKLGIDDPYVILTAPRENCGKLSRHRHKRYQFNPLPNAGEL